MKSKTAVKVHIYIAIVQKKKFINCAIKQKHAHWIFSDFIGDLFAVLSKSARSASLFLPDKIWPNFVVVKR
jgi:hypothetical protein